MPTDKVDDLFEFSKKIETDSLNYIHASECHASRSSKKTVTGEGYVRLRSDKHCRHN